MSLRKSQLLFHMIPDLPKRITASIQILPSFVLGFYFTVSLAFSHTASLESSCETGRSARLFSHLTEKPAQSKSFSRGTLTLGWVLFTTLPSYQVS